MKSLSVPAATMQRPSTISTETTHSSQRSSKERRRKGMARNKYDVDEVLTKEFHKGHLKELLKYILPYKKSLFKLV